MAQPPALWQSAATYIFRLGEGHDLVERLPAIVRADRMVLKIADMVVGGDEDAYRVGFCTYVSEPCPLRAAKGAREIPCRILTLPVNCDVDILLLARPRAVRGGDTPSKDS